MVAGLRPASASAAKNAATVRKGRERVHASAGTPGGEGGEVVTVGAAGAWRLVLLGEVDGAFNVSRRQLEQGGGFSRHNELGTAKDVVRIREKNHASQGVFAAFLNVGKTRSQPGSRARSWAVPLTSSCRSSIARASTRWRSRTRNTPRVTAKGIAPADACGGERRQGLRATRERNHGARHSDPVRTL
jgi:hypothetical protein